MTDETILDLSATVAADTATIDMLIPGTTKPSGWKIQLAGPSHSATVALATEVGREAIEREKSIEVARVNGRKWKGDGEDLEERRRRSVSYVCRRIVGWTPNPTFKFISPDPVAFTTEVATNLFLRPEMGGYFVQITDYLGSESAFTQPSGNP
jgi:hypothetical protein